MCVCVCVYVRARARVLCCVGRILFDFVVFGLSLELTMRAIMRQPVDICVVGEVICGGDIP